MPQGVSLCDIDNPGHIKAPSSLQVHGTMLLGVAVGVIGVLLLFNLAIHRGGPFSAQIVGSSGNGNNITVQIQVKNTGSEASIATCRVTRDGSPRSDDLSIRTDSVPANSSIIVERQLPIPDAPPAYDPTKASVSCT